MEVREERTQTQYFKVQTCCWSYIGAEEIMQPGSSARYPAITNLFPMQEGEKGIWWITSGPLHSIRCISKTKTKCRQYSVFFKMIFWLIRRSSFKNEGWVFVQKCDEEDELLMIKTLKPFSLISPKGLVFLSDCQFMVHFQIPFVVYWQFINLTLLSFGAGWFFVVGAVLCIAGCLVASLPSTC